MWTVIQTVNKTMVNSPQRGEKEVLEDTPLFVCYDTTFKRKGNQPELEVQHILQHLLPSTVTLLEKTGLDLRYKITNLSCCWQSLVGGPTATGQPTSVTARSHTEGAKQLKVILYTLQQSSSAAQDKSVTRHPQWFLIQLSAAFLQSQIICQEKNPTCLTPLLGSALVLLLVLI